MLAQRVGYIDPQGHFDALESIQCKEAKLFVEYVQAHGRLERRARLEAVENGAGFLCFLPSGDALTNGAKQPGAFTKRMPVPAQAVIANALQVFQCLRLIGNRKSPVL